MPIIYSLVARKSVILAEYTGSTGNFTTITKRILDKIPSQNSKMSYVYDKHVFHYIVNDGLTFMCMADEAFSRRLAFAFLEDIKGRFHSSFGDRGRVAVAYMMNAEFSKVLHKQMDFFSNDPNADKLTQVSADVNEVKNIMVDNIEKVIDRGEKIDLLVDKTQNLTQRSVQFKTSATKLKNVMWWKNLKLILIIVAVVIVLVYILVCIICGGLAWQGCIKK